MSRCAPFRAELERTLVASGALARLARDAHLRDCAACRAELAREDALEVLLDRLPAPEVPATLAGRVLARLAPARSGRAPFPTERAEGDELDELLARVPPPRVPAALAARVLTGLAAEREPRPAVPISRAWTFLAAAVLLAAVGLWAWTLLRPEETRLELAQTAELEGDEELLTYTVERWELLNDEDLDLWLASLDPVDELLIEFADGETWLDEGAEAARPEGD